MRPGNSQDSGTRELIIGVESGQGNSQGLWN